MAAELEQVPLSALRHWHYCPRQCGLIHLEQVFGDNVHTLRGQAVHAKVDKPGVETAKGVRVERASPLWHDALGLVGKSGKLPAALEAVQAAKRCEACSLLNRCQLVAARADFAAARAALFNPDA